MPPTDMSQPPAEDVKRIIDWIENDFIEAQCSAAKSSVSVVIRRLNRQEYNNTIRDLIGLDLRLADDFPQDDIGFGYDNIGSALKVSPIHIEKYFEAAERAIEAAIVLPDAENSSPAELIGLRTHKLPPAEAVEFEHTLSPGRYLIDFSLVRVGVAESVTPPRLEIGLGTDTRAVEAVSVQDETRVRGHSNSGHGRALRSGAAGQPVAGRFRRHAQRRRFTRRATRYQQDPVFRNARS